MKKLIIKGKMGMGGKILTAKWFIIENINVQTLKY
jgi:hypothetical protein